MKEDSLYPGINQLFGVCLNQDCHYWGEAVSMVMQANASKIKAWAQSSPGHFLVIDKNVGRSVGYGIARETGKLTPMSNVRVVLKYQRYN